MVIYITSMAQSLVSFFSGAGGMDIGFHMAGFNTLACYEFDENCCETLRKNLPDTKIFLADVSLIKGEDVLKEIGLKRGELDLVVGGPPCQSFSLAGNRKGMFDKRGKLVEHYIRIIKELAPKVFLMENVKGMLSWNAGQAVRFVEEAFEEPIKLNGKTVSYTVSRQCLDAADFGVAQHRQRLFFIGTRLTKTPIAFPTQTHFSKHDNPLITPHHVGVRKALEGLPSPDAPSELAMRISKTIKLRHKKLGYE